MSQPHDGDLTIPGSRRKARSSRTAIIAVAWAVVVRAVPLQAQTVNADFLVEQGLSLRDRGDLDGAARIFQRAWDEGHSPRAEAQLAITEQGMGRWSAADRHLREALGATAHPWIQQNRARLEQALAAIATHLGSVQVRGGVDGAAVLYNGQPLTTLPMTAPARVDVGSGVIEIRAEGYHPWSRPVTVAAGGLFVETATLIPIAAARGDGSSTPTPSGSGDGSLQRTLVWAAFGVAGAGLALGIGFNVVRENHFADYNGSVCGQPEVDPSQSAGCNASFATLQQQADDAFPWIVTGYVAAGAFAITGLVLHLTAPSRSASPDHASWACGPGAMGRSVECAVTF